MQSIYTMNFMMFFKINFYQLIPIHKSYNFMQQLLLSVTIFYQYTNNIIIMIKLNFSSNICSQLTCCYGSTWFISTNITRHFFIGYGSCISSRSGSGSYSSASGDHRSLWSVLHGDVINGICYQVKLFSDSV